MTPQRVNPGDEIKATHINQLVDAFDPVVGHRHDGVDSPQLTASDVGAAPSSHTHAPSDIESGGAVTGQILQWDGTAWVPANAPEVSSGFQANAANSSLDWNTVTDPGVYPVLLHGGAPNGPGVQKFMYCMVLNYGNGTAITQIAWPYSAGDTVDVAGLWVRGYASGAWSPWRLYGGWTQTITNANGTAVRYPDGTQICWISSVAVSPSGYTWTYPAAFMNANISVLLTMQGGAYDIVGAKNITATSATLVHSSTGYTRGLTAVAIGRWK